MKFDGLALKCQMSKTARPPRSSRPRPHHRGGGSRWRYVSLTQPLYVPMEICCHVVARLAARPGPSLIPRAPGLSFTTAGYAEPGPARTFRLSPADIFTIRKVEVVVGVEVGIGATAAGRACVCGIGAMLGELMGASRGAAFCVTATARRAELSSGVAEAHGFASNF